MGGGIIHVATKLNIVSMVKPEDEDKTKDRTLGYLGFNKAMTRQLS